MGDEYPDALTHLARSTDGVQFQAFPFGGTVQVVLRHDLMPAGTVY